MLVTHDLDWTGIAVWSAFLVSSGCILFVFVRYCLIRSIQAELDKKAPKVATNICDKGHVYPKDLSLKLDSQMLLGFADDVELCPVCYDKNMRQLSKVAPSAETTDIKV